MVGGSCSDVEITQSCGALLRLISGRASLADKGFLMHNDFAKNNHELLTPFKMVSGAQVFTADDMSKTSLIARNRVHVERAFKRVQEWKILHKTIKLSQLHIFSAIWFICCMMSNYESPLIRDGAEYLRSVYEMVWGDQNTSDE